MDYASAVMVDSLSRSAAARRSRRFAVGVGVLVLPALAFVTIGYLYPMARILYLSVGGFSFSPTYFIEFFADEIYVTILFRTFSMATITTLTCLLLGYPTAYLLTTVGKRYRTLLLFFVVVPYLTSFLVRTYAWMVLLNDNGPVNATLIGLGLVGEPVKLLYSSIGVHIGMVHVLLPIMVLSIYAVMSNIDPRLVRAAYSLGAGPTRGFLKVFLPLSMPGVTSGGLLVFLIALGFYITPVMLGGLKDTMLVNLIDMQVTQLGDWNTGAAAAVVLLVTTLAAVFVVRQLSRSTDVLGLSDVTGRTQAAATAGVGPVEWLRCRLAGNATVRALDDAVTAVAARFRRRDWERLRRRNRRPVSYGRAGVMAFGALVLLFLILPTFVVIPLSFSSASFLTFPPPGWSLKWYQHFFNEEGWVKGTLLSFQVGLITTVLVTILGTLAAYGLVRGRSRFRVAVMALLVSPLIVPPIVVGIGLYWALADFRLIGTVASLVIAHGIGSLAYVVVLVTAVLSRFDVTLERAAMSCGAGPLRTFRLVTFPLIRPGIIAAAVFAFIHSFDELVITYLISPFGMKTLPRMMWQNIRNEIDPVIAASSTMLILLPLIVLVILKVLYRKAYSKVLRPTPPLEP